MPIPSPKSNESRDDYISRCIAFQKDEGSDRSDKQMAAICYDKWRKSKVENYEIEDISKKDIKDMGSSLLKEIVERKKAGEMKFLANPEEGTKAYKEFWKEVKKELTDEEISWITEKEADINQENKEEIEELEPELDFLEDIKEGKVFENFVLMVGSTAENEKKGNDIDILVRDIQRDKSDPFRRAIQQRIIKSFPEDIKEDLHIFAESAGPHSDYIPLYDLILKRKDWSEIEKHSFTLEVDIPFEPKKPSEVAHYDKGKLLKEMEKKDYNYIVEKKIAGFHAIATNRGDPRVYSEEKKEFKGLSSFNKELNKINEKDFVITGELIYGDSGLGSRRELMKYIDEGNPDDSKVKMIIWDIVSYDGEDLTDEPLTKRKEYLDKLDLSESDRITEVPSIKVNTKEEGKEAIEEYSNKKNSEGVVVKRPDSLYEMGTANQDWMKFRKTQLFNARVISEDKVKDAEAWNYEIGIDLSDSDVELVKKDYIKEVNGQKVMSLGQTFNTDIKVSPGDVLKIRIEEVWRHEYNKNESTKIRYSIHKPSVVEKLKTDSTDSIKRLDNIVSNLGVAVQENTKEMEEKPDEEGGTRSEAAKKFWRENWHTMYPKDGEGEYIYQCLDSETPVMNKNGRVLNIGEVKEGDILFDNGQFTKVEKKWVRKDNIIKFDMLGVEDIKCSPDHRFKIIENGRNIRRKYRDKRWKREEKRKNQLSEYKDNIRFKEARNITTDDVILLGEVPKIDIPDEIPMTEEFWKLVGWYVSEGYYDKREGKQSYANITQSYGENYDKIIDLAEELDYDYLEQNQSKSNIGNIKIKNSKFIELMNKYFGSYSLEKKLPPFVYSLPRNLKLSLLYSMIDGDGTEHDRIYTYYTSSRSLAYGVFWLTTSLGVPPSITKDKRDKIGKNAINYHINISKKCLGEDVNRERNMQRWYNLENGIYGSLVKGIKRHEKEQELIDVQTTSSTFSMPLYSHNCHWRGLSEEEANKMTHKELLDQGEHSVHGDLRGSVTKDSLWGFTVFEGDAEDIPEETLSKLIYMSKHKGEESFKKLQGQYKMEIPGSWLDVGKEKPLVSEPGGVGSTKDSYSKFFALDFGDYKIGVQHSHFFEYFLDGEEMNGRVLIMYAPVGGERKWLIDFPEDQEPEAKSTTIEEKVKELRKSDTDHEYLIWNDPESEEKPKKINIKEYEIEDEGENQKLYNINNIDKLAERLWNRE